MRIPKLFKKAAAFVMAAVTALSVMPATTAFAAGDIGTISFSMTYDSGGNAMRYNSSANINGYTAGIHLFSRADCLSIRSPILKAEQRLM